MGGHGEGGGGEGGGGEGGGEGGAEGGNGALQRQSMRKGGGDGGGAEVPWSHSPRERIPYVLVRCATKTLSPVHELNKSHRACEASSHKLTIRWMCASVGHTQRAWGSRRYMRTW
jgi:hypothetical protein